MAEDAPPVARRNWISLISVLIVQAQNSFNDNFVKMVLLGLGAIVAKDVIVGGANLGENIKFILTLLIPLPFILGAPVAGWVSDRFSKRNVIVGSLVVQILLFAFIFCAIQFQSVFMAIVGYFLLAVQSTFFSPAKQGILKELVGSARLGFANGLMMMLTMVGILGGVGIGGFWFDKLLAHHHELNGILPSNAWAAAKVPVLVIGGSCILPLLLSLIIQKTPSHASRTFRHGIWLEHFKDLGQLFKQVSLGALALRISFYWLIANSLGLILLTFSEELFSDIVKGGASQAYSMMMLAVGVGLMLGSTTVSLLSRTAPQPRLIPLGAIGMLVGMVLVGVLPPDSFAFKVAIGIIGFSSGFFLVPMAALFQDGVKEKERAAMIAASNLLNSLAGLIAILLCFLLNAAGMTASIQMFIMAAALVVITLTTFKFARKQTSAGG
ncbi:MAG: MFS transporter [Verrucomicrobiota bacterium]